MRRPFEATLSACLFQLNGPLGGALAADGALWVATHSYFAKVSGLCVERKQPPHQRVSVSDYELQDFVCLNGSDDAREHAQDACFPSGGGELGRRGLRVKAPVAGPLIRDEC